MSRKQQLRDSLSQNLNYDNHGTVQNRRYRHLVLTRIIDDLFKIRLVPANWYALTTEQVQQLVQFWLKMGLKTSTIMNYLVCLRYFLTLINHDLKGIDNASLALKKPRKPIKPSLDVDAVLKTIQEPIAFLLFALQTKFGLTLHEAMHLTPVIHVQEQALWITRELSINYKDRFVPITTPEQHAILTQLNHLTGFQNSLAQQFSEQHLRLAYHFTLSALKLPTHFGYRYLYAKTRFATLCRCYNKTVSKKMIIAEMSINKTSPLWASIHE